MALLQEAATLKYSERYVSQNIMTISGIFKCKKRISKYYDNIRHL